MLVLWIREDSNVNLNTCIILRKQQKVFFQKKRKEKNKSSQLFKAITQVTLVRIIHTYIYKYI